MKFAGLSESLPPNVQILTLEPWKRGTVLLRLEHIFELKESKKYSIPVEVNLQVSFKFNKPLSSDLFFFAFSKRQYNNKNI